MSRRYAHAVLGHLDGAEELVGFGRTPADALRAARESAMPTAAELAARSHTRGRKPPRGISLAELGARYDRQRGVAVGATPKRSVLRWETGQRVPTPEARRLLERALSLPRGALDAVEAWPSHVYHQDRIDRAEREGRGLCEVDCNECEVRADGGPCRVT